MLTLLMQLVPSPAPAAHWLWHPPSIFTIVDLTVTAATLIALVVLWRRKLRGVSPRQVNELVARLDAIEIASGQRDERDQSFRRDLIEANEALLKERRNQNDLLGRLLRRTEYVANTLDSRPCLLHDENNGDKGCPDDKAEKE